LLFSPIVADFRLWAKAVPGPAYLAPGLSVLKAKILASRLSISQLPLWHDPCAAYPPRMSGAGHAPAAAQWLSERGDPMAADQASYVYLGLAGETGPGRAIHTGLFRLADGSDEWEPLRNGLSEAPAVRALAVHPRNPEIIYAGTQSGPYRSADRGEHWEKVDVLDHGLPVWSVLFHPHDPDVMFVGYENCESTAVTMPANIGPAYRSACAFPRSRRHQEQIRQSGY